jgi:osmotically-inducible protein OsmY
MGKTMMKTDSQVQQDVLTELNWDPSLNAAQIGVEVKDGIVILAGHVSSYDQKWRAERAAQRVSGVRGLAVEMDVKLSGLNNRNDADIARTVEIVLEWTTNVPKDCVKVMVEGGWITLSGQVEWEYQRLATAKAVRYLMGVTGVSNNILIDPKGLLGAVKSDIEFALKRQAKTDAQNISVEVKGDQVTLTGSVHSWSEREQARHSAWGTPGVRYVEDHITVDG